MNHNLGTPDFELTVYGKPAPQGSKSPKGKGRMVESSEYVPPWREAVKAAAIAAMKARSIATYGGVGQVSLLRLDGPLVADMVFTMGYKPNSKPTWWPAGERWSKTLWWRPASAPDLSKLIRGTEDALQDAGAIRDDARIVGYGRLDKVFVDQPGDPDALQAAGAVIRLWKLPVEVAA